MKYILFSLISISVLVLSSCNQGKIDELEYEISKLEKENKALKSHIEELEEVISSYELYHSRYTAQQEQREWHQRNAQQHLQTAEFWRQNGDDFLYESSMRQAQQELNMIP